MIVGVERAFSTIFVDSIRGRGGIGGKVILRRLSQLRNSSPSEGALVYHGLETQEVKDS
jgi:hypothetical protein